MFTFLPNAGCDVETAVVPAPARASLGAVPHLISKPFPPSGSLVFSSYLHGLVAPGLHSPPVHFQYNTQLPLPPITSADLQKLFLKSYISFALISPTYWFLT